MGLLGQQDPPPFDVFNADSGHPVLLVCEHAGRAVPTCLDGLGIAAEAMNTHIAYDIGAEIVARILASLLSAPLVLQPYSRLVIDCNRPVDVATSIPALSDGVPVPGNREIDFEHRQARIDAIFTPFQDAVSELLDAAPRQAAFAIHSFTPELDGVARQWDISFLFRKDEATSLRLAEAVRGRADDLVIGLNQPYQIHDSSDWFVPRHGEARHIPHSLIEIRNDHLRSPTSCAKWARILAAAITDILPEL